MRTVCGPMIPAASMASIMATPMRSLTLAAGLKNSSLAKMAALTPCCSGSRRSRTIGVSPIASVMELNTRPRPGRRAATGCAGLAIASLEDMIGPCGLIGGELLNCTTMAGSIPHRPGLARFGVRGALASNRELAAGRAVAACDHAGGLEQLLHLERVAI